MEKNPLAKNGAKVELPGRVFQAIQAQLWSNLGLETPKNFARPSVQGTPGLEQLK